MSKTIYMVEGDNGNSYSDYSSWYVCAYELREDAESHAEAAQQWMRDNPSHFYDPDNATQDKKVSPFDPKWDTEQHGSDGKYYVRAIELHDAFQKGQVSHG